jgi:putative transposase
VALVVGGSGLVNIVVCLSVPSRNVRGMFERWFRRTPGGVCSLGLNLEWCPKYRRRILGGQVAARYGGLLERVAGERGWQTVAREVVPDHVHLFAQIGPIDAPAQVVRAFTGRTARVLRSEFPCLRRLEKVLWSPSYIEHQWDAVAL